MRHALATALALAVLAHGSPLTATTSLPQTFTCPVGGETFEDDVIASRTTSGRRPDGRPYGSLEIVPLVECPGNGLVLFDNDFTADEIALLTPLVASARYQAMRQGETPHYRAWWLMRALGREPAVLAGTLLTASWESDRDRERKARYQNAFVEAAQAVPRSEAQDWFHYTVRAANALRELGRFEEAGARLDLLEASEAWPKDPDSREGARLLIEGLRALIAERNRHSEPTNLVPARVAARRCLDRAAELTASEGDACASPGHVEAIGDYRRFRADYPLPEGPSAP